MEEKVVFLSRHSTAHVCIPALFYPPCPRNIRGDSFGSPWCLPVLFCLWAVWERTLTLMSSGSWVCSSLGRVSEGFGSGSFQIRTPSRLPASQGRLCKPQTTRDKQQQEAWMKAHKNPELRRLQTFFLRVNNQQRSATSTATSACSH